MRSLLGVAFLILCGCSGSDWTGFVYPDIEDIPNADQVQNYIIGNFRTFEECQTAAIERMRHLYATTGRQGDYQCGYKCTRKEEFGGLLICKEDRK